MAWEVAFTDEFEAWWDTLTEAQQHALSVRVALLEQHGPTLKRPVVGEIKGSKYNNMKELICDLDGAHFRVLFMFDPLSGAILLLGGDKTGLWAKWYKQAIPEADRIYEEYLGELKKDGLIK